MAEVSRLFVCTICNSFGATRFQSVLTHIGSVHKFGPVCPITCGIDGCPYTSSTETFDTFRSHVYRKHGEALCGISEADEVVPPPSSNVNDDNQLDQDWSEDRLGEPLDLKRAAALFQLKTLEERRVTQKALTGITSDCKELWQIGLQALQQSLKEHGHDVKLSDIVSEQLLNPFCGLGTQYLQHKYWQENFPYVVSKK